MILINNILNIILNKNNIKTNSISSNNKDNSDYSVLLSSSKDIKISLLDIL